MMDNKARNLSFCLLFILMNCASLDRVASNQDNRENYSRQEQAILQNSLDYLENIGIIKKNQYTKVYSRFYSIKNLPRHCIPRLTEIDTLQRVRLDQLWQEDTIGIDSLISFNHLLSYELTDDLTLSGSPDSLRNKYLTIRFVRPIRVDDECWILSIALINAYNQGTILALTLKIHEDKITIEHLAEC